jgi:hypothetical protein
MSEFSGHEEVVKPYEATSDSDNLEFIAHSPDFNDFMKNNWMMFDASLRNMRPFDIRSKDIPEELRLVHYFTETEEFFKISNLTVDVTASQEPRVPGSLNWVSTMSFEMNDESFTFKAINEKVVLESTSAQGLEGGLELESELILRTLIKFIIGQSDIDNDTPRDVMIDEDLENASIPEKISVLLSIFGNHAGEYCQNYSARILTLDEDHEIYAKKSFCETPVDDNVVVTIHISENSVNPGIGTEFSSSEHSDPNKTILLFAAEQITVFPNTILETGEKFPVIADYRTDDWNRILMTINSALKKVS